MKLTLRTAVGITCSVISLGGCVKDPTLVAPEIPVPSARGVYITCEGNFGRGNATLTYYDLGSFHVYNDVFTAVNGKNLGDVAVGMILRGSKGYIVVNNSSRIEIVDLQTNVNSGTISTGSGSSPRHMAFVNDTLALVTDLFADAVLRIDVLACTVVGRVPVGPNPEGIAIAEGKAYVANSGFGSGNTVSIISLASMSVAQTLRVADNPIGVERTPTGMVYVVCAGSYDYTNPANDTPAYVMVIDPTRDAIVDSVFIGGHASSLAVGADGIGYVPSTLGLMRIDTRVHKMLGTFLAGSYYAVGVEIVTGDVYVADAKNFILPGTVSVYAPNGQFRTQFETGIIPGSFTFKR